VVVPQAIPPEPLFPRVLERLAGNETQTVVLPRTDEQRDEIGRLGPCVVPERAVDAQSLVAFADLVVSAGGTMNREAVALGTPVCTTFERRTEHGGLRVRRDPRELVTLLLSASQA
jgi:predicted glycosyltransferase